MRRLFLVLVIWGGLLGSGFAATSSTLPLAEVWPLMEDGVTTAKIYLGGDGKIYAVDATGAASPLRSAAASSPVDAEYVVLTANGTLTAERILTGTTNQIVVTDGGAGAAVTLSTPQNIHSGATPVFGGITLNGAADLNGNNVTNGGVGNFTTVNTGQGGNELYAMDQDVESSDSPAFSGLTINGTPTFNGATTIDGAADAIQLTIQGNLTQTTDHLVIENSAGTDLVVFNRYGGLSVNLDNSAGGDFIWENDTGPVVTFDADGNLEFALNAEFNNGLNIYGSSDIVQLTARGHSTQASDFFVIENNVATDIFTVDQFGAVTMNEWSNSGGDLIVKNDSGNIIHADADGDLTFNPSANGETVVTGNLNVDSNTLFVDATGNEIGIGTTTPEQLLDLTVTNGQPKMVFNTYQNSSAFPAIEWRNSNSDTEGTDSATPDARFLGRMLYYGVNSSNASDLGAVFQVIQDGSAVSDGVPAKFQFINYSGNTAQTALEIQADGGLFMNNLGTGTGNNAAFDASTNELYDGTSTREHKDDIRKVPEKILSNMIKQLKPLILKMYERKGNGQTEISYIAEEVAEISPLFVNYKWEPSIEKLGTTSTLASISQSNGVPEYVVKHWEKRLSNEDGTFSQKITDWKKIPYGINFQMITCALVLDSQRRNEKINQIQNEIERIKDKISR